MRRYDEHQAQAQKNSWRLFLYMSVMQLITITLAGIAVGYLFGILALLSNWEHWHDFNMWPTVLRCAAIVMPLVGLVILGHGIVKYYQLKAGGKKVAELLHAQPVNEGTKDPRQRQLLNIVQELAISSGIPVPPVYVMRNELGINALAAGHKPQDAVIIVTEGAIKRLGRDQIQGVMAHEFAHILNGDIGRNMLLMAITHGNYSVITAAQGMIDAEPVMINQDSIGGEALGTAIGYILWPIGAFGACIALYFTALIKRQGEYMADATAVEMTRLPNGLSDALMFIGGNEHQSKIKTSSAFEASHLFFAESGWALSSAFDPHPPLNDRIMRLKPEWDGHYLFESEDELGAYGQAYDEVVDLVGLANVRENPEKVVPIIAAVAGAATAATTSAPTQAPTAPKLEDAPGWMCLEADFNVEIDPAFIQFAEDHNGAGLILAAIRLDQFEADKAETILNGINPLIQSHLRQLAPQVAQLDDAQKVTLFDMALHTTGTAPAMVRTMLAQFVQQTSTDLTAETNVARWAWQRLVSRKLSRAPKPKAKFGKLHDVTAETALLISSVIHTEPNMDTAGQYVFMRAMAHTEIEEISLIENAECTIERLEYSLSEIAAVAAREKRKILVACGVCVTSDREINMEEAFIIRAICEGLHYPMPKLIPGQPIVAGV